MRFGLKEPVIVQICQVLKQYSDVEKAIIYGSRARGKHRPASDIDLTLVGRGMDLQTRNRIASDLDDLLLPWEIDLSVLHCIEDPEVLDHIDRVGKELYVRD